MVAKHLAMALLGSALMAAPALAQTSSGSGSTTSPSTGSSSMSSSSMSQMHAGQWRTSQIEGLDVYNQNNEKIGDISEMLVDQSGKIQAVVVGVGGFLGIGERDVAIAFDQVKFMNEPRANTTASTNTNAPGTATTTAPSTTGSTTGSTASSTAADNANRMAPDHAVVNMTKEQLQGMPEFRRNR